MTCVIFLEHLIQLFPSWILCWTKRILIWYSSTFFFGYWYRRARNHSFTFYAVSNSFICVQFAAFIIHLLHLFKHHCEISSCSFLYLFFVILDPDIQFIE